jgi:hypothetical protein
MGDAALIQILLWECLGDAALIQTFPFHESVNLEKSNS